MFSRGGNGAKDVVILKWTLADFESLLRVGIDNQPTAGVGRSFQPAVEATDAIPPCCKTGLRFRERELHSV